MDVVVGLVLLLLGATAATAITRTLEPRGRGPLLAAAVAPAGVLVGTGAALVRGWSLVPSAVVGMVLVGALALATGLRVDRRRGRGGGSA